MQNDESQRESAKTNEHAGNESDHSGPETVVESGSKYPEWDRLQDDVARQIRANRSFLERCLEDEFPEEDEDEDEEDEPENETPVG